MGFTPYRDNDLDFDLDATWDPRFPPPFREATRYALPDLSPLYFDGNAGFPTPQLGGLGDWIKKAAGAIAGAAPVVGAAVGGIVGGAAGAQKGAEIGGQVAQVANAIKQATGSDPPPEAVAAATDVLEAGGTINDAHRAALEITKARIARAASMRTAFAGDNSSIRAALVSMKTGQPVPVRPAVSAYTGSDSGYSTRLYSAGGGVPASSSSAANAAEVPIYKNPWVIAGAVAALGAGIVYMQHQRGRR